MQKEKTKKLIKDEIALRSNSKGYLEYVFVKNVKLFRIEKMDNNLWWLCCSLANGEQITWNIFPEASGLRLMTTEFPQKAKYEKGSLRKEF